MTFRSKITEIDGNVVWTAKQYRDRYRNDAVAKRRMFHVIQPKYCRMIGLNPDLMFVVSIAPIWTATLIHRIDKAFDQFSSIVDVRKRVWLAHVAAYRGLISDKVLQYIKRHVLLLPKSLARVKLPDRTMYPARRGRICENKDDLRLHKIVTMPSTREARTWTNGGSGSPRLLGLVTTSKQSKALIEKIYSLGAKGVYVAKIRRDATGERSGTLIIELPHDAKARNRLLNEEAKYAKMGGFERVQDTNQRFMLLKLD